MLEDQEEFDRKCGNVMDAIERDPELRAIVRRQQGDVMARQKRDEDGMWPDVSTSKNYKIYQNLSKYKISLWWLYSRVCHTGGPGRVRQEVGERYGHHRER